MLQNVFKSMSIPPLFISGDRWLLHSLETQALLHLLHLLH